MAAPSDNLKKRLDIVNNKAYAIEEGLQLLEDALNDLKSSKKGMEFWNNVDVISNTLLVPLNCIINAFELKAANTLYKTVVKTLYAKFSKSGSRVEGHAGKALGTLKTALVEAMKTKAPEFVPGVNIIVGLAEDSLALYQAV